MSAIEKCLSRGHHPYVEVGDPDLPAGSPSEYPLQVIEYMRVNSRVICIDKYGGSKAIPVDWILSYKCEFEH